MKSDVHKGEATDYARIEVISGEGDQISRVNASQLESHMEPLTGLLHGEIAFDGAFEGREVSILIDS